MICRMWRGWTTAQNASPYERYLIEELFPRMQAELAAHGYRGHQLLRVDGQEEVEFVVLTWFDSLESIRSFSTGPDPEVAVISAMAARLLLRYEPRAVHFHRASETLSRTALTLFSDNTTRNGEMFKQFDRKMVEGADATISCVIGGDGPPVLMLHGFPQNLAMWARVAPALAQKFTVVCADLRGYGDSGKPRCAPDRSNYSFRAMAGDQVELMKKLGFERFHVIGHDRGGRAAHRMALDWPQVVASLAVLDIVPTHTMFMQTNRHVAGAYWHWYFLSQPEPFPERLIGADPDFFYETCLAGWGATRIEDFDRQQLADYRRCWRDPAMIHGSCSDYRAAATVDLDHDTADIERRVACPTLALWGSNGLMHRHFDIGNAWRQRCIDLRAESLPGGHFFVDQLPEETARVLTSFLDG